MALLGRLSEVGGLLTSMTWAGIIGPLRLDKYVRIVAAARREGLYDSSPVGMTMGSVTGNTGPNTDVSYGPRSGLRHRSRPLSTPVSASATCPAGMLGILDRCRTPTFTPTCARSPALPPKQWSDRGP